jgi:hypothetical protein
MAAALPSVPLPLTIFTHKGCWDAFVCVWSVLRTLPHELQAVDWSYYTARMPIQAQPVVIHFLAPHQTREADVPPYLYRNRYVLFLDIMPQESWLQGALRYLPRQPLTIVDHHDFEHSSVVDTARKLQHTVVHNTAHAACELAWAHFHAAWEPVPWFIKYFAAGDLHRFNDPAVPHAREVSLALANVPHENALPWLNHLLRYPQERRFATLVEAGAQLHMAQLASCMAYLKVPRRGLVPLRGDDKIMAWCMPYHGKDLCMGLMTEQVSKQLNKGEPVILILFRHASGQQMTRVWLRTNDPQNNMAAIACRLLNFISGGGHKGAAGAWLKGTFMWFPV